MKRYEFSKHTADVAVSVYGGSLKELFTSAALAMFGVLVSKKQNRPQADLVEVAINRSEESLEDLLKAWLDELLFYSSSRSLVLRRIKSLDVTEEAMEAKVLFETFDKDFFEPGQEIKAVTYHELKVEKVKNGWKANIIFDV
ncbi:MAG TPA: hypothetical protein DCL35_07525 [Candidatus Omnitrophica bacterium]|nr:hypothetical protein [Candidatus Omnitrophota bacterium]